MRKAGRLYLLLALMLLVGAGGGVALRLFSNWRISQTAVIRVGNERTMVDYDLQAAVNYLVYRLEQDGYTVVGTAYSGEMYPPKLNFAGLNVFVRGFLPFYDVRLNENGQNWFYLHRSGPFFKEELRHYDLYLFSQKNFYDEVKDKLAAVYWEGRAVPHKRLEPQYEYDVLYIFEDDKDGFEQMLKNSLKAKTYGAMAFAALSEAERETALKQARVVMYQMMPEKDADYDVFYVPYAVYDIMSYGRPVVTNRRQKLEQNFSGKVWFYDDETESKVRALQEVLRLTDEEREQLAMIAREELKRWESEKKHW